MTEASRVGRVGSHARATFASRPGPDRRGIALRAAIALALPLVGLTVAGRPADGFLAGSGVFAVLYGAAQPARRRVRTQLGAGLGLLLAVGAGILTAGQPVATLAATVLAATVATFLTFALAVGPPAGFFFVLVLGIGNLAADHGAAPLHVLWVTALGVLSAVVVGTSDAWLGSRQIEEGAVGRAEQLVADYAREDDPEEAARSRRAASDALHRAWTAVADGGHRERYTARLQRAHSHYVAAVARTVGHAPGEREGVTAELVATEAVRARQVSLGRVGAGWRLRQALRWPSEDLLVTVRVAVAALVAGGVAQLLDNPHAYWAAAFAMLVLHQGGTRISQVQRLLQRSVGTLGGLLLFAVVLLLDPGTWTTVALVVLLQGVVELLVVRNYAQAVTLMTPLALIISVAATGLDEGSVVLDRLLDTGIALAVALVVLLVSGRLARPELLLKAHAGRVLETLDDVLRDLVEHRTRTDHGMTAHLEHCRRLSVELLASDTVARRALADAPERLGTHRETEQLLAHVGYAVLGAAWHPSMRGEQERLAQAQRVVAGLLEHPRRRERPAAEVAAELRQVQQALRA